MELSRRDVLKSGVLAGAATALGLSVQGVVALAEDGSVIYEGRAQGLRGWVRVHVATDGNSITAVDVVETSEQPWQVCGKAISVVPGRILAGQSVNVDGVTGATFTSNAIMAAASQALEGAGVLDKFQSAWSEPVEGAAEDVEVDLLVVGAGAAGCVAALAARYENFDGVANDLSVMVVERNGFYGGSSMLSGGSIGTVLPLNDNANVDKLFDEYMAAYEGGTFAPNRDLTHEALLQMGANTLAMQALGYPIVTAGMTGDPADFSSLTAEVRRYRYGRQYYSADHWPWQGVDLQTFFDERFDAAGIDVRLNTAAKSLIVEDGSCLGAVVEGPAGEYTVRAKKVILACGGIAQNVEMLEQYAPDYVGLKPYTNSGCRGDGIRMAVESFGAKVSGDYATGMLGPDIHVGFWSDLGAYFPGWSYNTPLVNQEGARFMRDCDGYDVYGSFSAACLQSDSTIFSLFDAENPAVTAFDGSTMEQVAPSLFKADTLEELAEQAGIDAAALVATVDTYNQTREASEEDEFGVPADAKLPVATAPFYAVRLQPYAYATNVGIEVSKDLEVLDGNGEIVPNLYAAGEMVWTGTGVEFLGGAVIMGRMAGELAKTAIQG